jgi:HEAT repeat protein
MTPNLIASVLFALVPQQAPVPGEAAAPAPTAVIAHANAFPDSTLFCVSLRADPHQIDALAKHPASKVLLQRLAAPGLTAGSLEQRLHAATGQGLASWLTLLHGGITLGITELADGGTPRWLLVADTQDQNAALTALLDRALQTPGASATTGNDGAPRTWIVPTPLGRTACAIDGNRLIAGDSTATITEAAQRLRSDARSGTLATTPGFADFELAASAQPSRLCAAFVRPNAICERALTALPPAAVTQVRGVLRALDVTRIASGGMALALESKDFVEAYHVDWPAPRNGPLAELLAPKATLRADVAALIPPDVDSFSASAVDLQRVFHAGMRLFGELAPRQASVVQAQITQWGERLGINLQDELLARIGSQLITMQWGQDDTAQNAALVQLTDAPAFDRALRKALSAGNVPVREESVNGYRALVLDRGDEAPGLTITEDSLLVGSSTRAMQRVLDQMAAPRGAQTAIKIPAGVSAYAVAKLAPLVAQFATTLGARAGTMLPGSSEVADLMREVGAALRDANLETSSARDDRSVSVQMRSPLGGVVAMTTLFAAAAALPHALARSEQQLGMARTQSVLPATLQRVVVAQREFQIRNGRIATTVQELVTAGLLRDTDVGRLVDEHTCERDGYCISLLLDTERNTDASIAVAWPAQTRVGPVYAATSDYALVNDVMASTQGLNKVELADVYSKGFGSPMRTGWRVQDAPVHSATTATPAPNSAGSKLATAVATLTQSKDDAAALQTLREALAADDPAKVAYAAHALGRLRLADEAPTLLALVAKHQDVNVRTQAMWALLQMSDPRSVQTSIETLGSDSVELRALAASNLGKLRAAEASQALLAVLTNQDHANASDERDRASALLALADIGDPAPLLQAAAAVSAGQPTTLQALAFAFQTLSPKLAPKDEATVLVGTLEHPQPILRRYAIQRLGELRDSTTARALEGRLGREDRELLPLVQVSLQAVRGDGNKQDRSVGETLTALWTRVRTTWDQLTPNHRYAALGGVLAVVLLLALISVLRGRARTQAQSHAWAAMATTAARPTGTARDEVDLPVGESGVYSPHDHDQDSLLHTQSGQYSGSHR